MLLDARIHPAGLSDADLETLRYFGVDGVVQVADGRPQAKADALLAHFEALVSQQLPRLKRAGLAAWTALGVHPGALPKRGLSQVLETLPAFCDRGRVVAIGLVGLLHGGEAEEEAVLAQLELAEKLSLPVVAAVPARQKEVLTRRLLTVLRDSGFPPQKVLVDGATGRTVRVIRECGHHAGLSLHPDHLTVEKAVALVRALGPERLVLSTAAGDGPSDIVALGRAVHRLEKAGLSRGVVTRVSGENAAAFYGVAV